MSTVVQLMADPRYPNILGNRSVPILFVAICFLIVANTRCDQVGSANEDSTNVTPKAEDPLSFFREIYLDQNSKIIAMAPNSRDTVQKFHPNGRYGRSFADASRHSELAKLRLNDGNRLSSILHNSLSDLSNNYQLKNHELNDLGPLVSDLDSSSSMDYQLEMNKLLKCNYTGVSNLYRCNLDK